MLSPNDQQSRRQISAQGLVEDIRSGFKDAALIEKYRLMERALKKLFAELFQAV